MLGGHAEDGKTRGIKGCVHEGIPFSAIKAIVGGVVELNYQERGQVIRRAENKVCVLPINQEAIPGWL